VCADLSSRVIISLIKNREEEKNVYKLRFSFLPFNCRPPVMFSLRAGLAGRFLFFIKYFLEMSEELLLPPDDFLRFCDFY
jgi:hypothetical protein